MPPATAPLGEATRTAAGRAGEPPHVISLLVRDEPGVLVRIALIFARRGYNIESLSVSSGLHERISRMTITCSGDPATLEQIRRQLAKLVDVVHALDHTGQSTVESETALLKLRCGIDERTAILQIAEHYHAKVVDFGPESVILRAHGGSEKLDALIELVKPLGLVEMVRSGKILLTRGLETT